MTKRAFTAIIGAAALTLIASVPASAVYFNGLATIYVASGVLDSDNNATAVHCTNISGESATLRFRFMSRQGVTLATNTQLVLQGATYSVATKAVAVFDEVALNTGSISQGMLAVNATELAVFCSAMIVNSASAVAEGIPLHMVRFNANPGTVE